MHTLRMLWAAQNEEIYLRRQRRNNSRRCLEKITQMPELLFIERFRLDKNTFNELCVDLRTHTTLRGTREIPLEVKVLCTLSFLATGSYQRIVGVPQHLPQRSTSRCIRQVVDAMNSSFIVNKWIKFPETHQERSRLRREFQERYQLPGVIGCIDCTQVAIMKPREDEHIYLDRRGLHSLNVQVICDHNLNILNINARYGGATHDASIWASSQVEMFMRELHKNGELTWLLGDAGYPQRPWLMTPILDAAPQSREAIYTARHIQARNCIERCFGVLKARWKCLLKHQTLHYHPNVARKIVHACCVLHNIALDAGLPAPSDVEQQDDDTVSVDSSFVGNEDEEMQGRAMLSGLVNRIR